MGYLLVKPEVLEDKGIKYFETLPDGRAIADFSMLKVLGSIENVEVVATTDELRKKVEMQIQSGMYDKPEPLPDEEENAGDVIDPGMEVVPETDGSDAGAGDVTDSEMQVAPEADGTEAGTGGDVTEETEQEGTVTDQPSEGSPSETHPSQTDGETSTEETVPSDPVGEQHPEETAPAEKEIINGETAETESSEVTKETEGGKK